MNKQGGASQLRHTSLLFYDAIMCTLSDAYHTVHDISIFCHDTIILKISPLHIIPANIPSIYFCSTQRIETIFLY